MSMEDRGGLIWWDGEMRPWRDARLHILSYTAQHGAGVFEGVRAYEGAAGTTIFRLKDHTRRLIDSAKILQMPMPPTLGAEQIDAAHIAAVRENGLKHAYIRANLFYDGRVPGVSAQGNQVHMSVAAWEWPAYRGDHAQGKGIRVKTSSFARLHVNSALRKAKCNGHYVNSMLAVHEAKHEGYDDALLLDTQGYAAECSTSNLFVLRDGIIATPERTAVLEGVTRATLMTLAMDRGWSVEERRITRDELYCADEIFVTGTAAEVAAVVELDRRPIGDGAPGQITRELQAAYHDAVTGRDPKHPEWLTPLD